MEEIVRKTLLFDFYGELLSEHQRSIYEAAVFNDLSLSEVAEQEGITRQAVQDILKRSEAKLSEYETRLHMIERYEFVMSKARELYDKSDDPVIRKIADEIIEGM